MTPEFLLSLFASALTGAGVAWQANRIMNDEILSHVKRHCDEHDAHTKADEKHDKRIRRIDRLVTVLWDRVVGTPPPNGD